MQLEVCASADAAAVRGAELIVAETRAAIAARGRALIAVSGGHTPWEMLRALALQEPDWRRIVVFQVDERACAGEDDARNLKHLQENLPEQAHIEAMPVETGERGAEEYAARIAAVAGERATLDVIHLGLGPDGHTASLIPDDPVLDVLERDVAWTHAYQGHRRMTLTYPMLNRARLAFWLVAGTQKRLALRRLLAQCRTIPAARVRAGRQLVIADGGAADSGLS